MFLQIRSYPEAYPLKLLRLSLNDRAGEDVITGSSFFHDLPQAGTHLHGEQGVAPPERTRRGDRDSWESR
jgi:hypothetical protein